METATAAPIVAPALACRIARDYLATRAQVAPGNPNPLNMAYRADQILSVAGDLGMVVDYPGEWWADVAAHVARRVLAAGGRPEVTA